MSCIHITAGQLALPPSAFPVQALQLNKASTCTSTYLRTRLPKISLKFTSAKPRYQQAATVCLFGDTGKSEDGNEASPWKALEKAAGNFKKDQSVENALRQQIQKQEYYDDDDGGSGGKRPGGGGGGGGGDGNGYGEAEDEGLSGMWDEFAQVTLATIGLLFVYWYIIDGEQIAAYTRDIVKFIFIRHMSFRLMRLIDWWKRFLERMKVKEENNPYWLERAILNTPTWYDSPAKYKYIIRSLLASSKI